MMPAAAELPEAFVRRMREMLGGEYEAFAASYDLPRRPGLRINRCKKNSDRLEREPLFGMEPIPWAPHGYYYDAAERPGKHPFHEAGVYYIQEPSAMAVAALSGVKPGMRVLDLCAAPGGKSTQLASMLGGKGVLYANEIHPARAKILSQNIERMGIGNAIVTNETPEKMAARFPLYFDTVVVDAPCSGEGMFRKEEEAIPNWSPENVDLCAGRQEKILDCAAEMTAAGGTLVYSTCTFSPQENERSILRFLLRHPDFEIVDLPDALGRPFMEETGLAAGNPEYALTGDPVSENGAERETAEKLKGCIRLWPHRLEGEGHFLAVMKKGGASRRRSASGKIRKDREVVKLWKTFEDEALTQEGAEKLDRCGEGGLILFGNELYRIPESASLEGLRVLRPGLHLGTVKKNRFEPSHALALYLNAEDASCCAEISEKDEPRRGDGKAASAFLRGESLREQDCSGIKGSRGWCLVTDCGYSIGWGKMSGGAIKNHYPKGLRRPY